MIESKRSELFSLEDNLNKLKKEHEVKELEIRYLQKQIDEFSVKKERATKLLNGLGGEKQKWLVCNRMIAKKFLTISRRCTTWYCLYNLPKRFYSKIQRVMRRKMGLID